MVSDGEMEGAYLSLRRGGPLGRPAGAGLALRSFLANSHCLPAVRPGGRTYVSDRWEMLPFLPISGKFALPPSGRTRGSVPTVSGGHP